MALLPPPWITRKVFIKFKGIIDMNEKYMIRKMFKIEKSKGNMQ